jgi:hypothetical protein
LCAILAGCSGPPAALDLIAAGRMALDEARQAELAGQVEQTERLGAHVAALDAAFDADVRLAETGALVGPDGAPIVLDGQWVIDARRGYAVALRAMYDARRDADQAHATRLDNLQAGDDALQMAEELITRDMNLREPIRQRLLALQRRWTHE